MDTVIVTGVSSGLGQNFAASLHTDGYRVIGIARRTDDEKPHETRSCDVSDPDAVRQTFKDLRRDRSVFALINAAGVASMNLTISTPPRTVKRIIETNLIGTILCCQATAPALILRGSGRIINFSSIAVPLGLKAEAVYVASKAGVEGFSRSFAREMADYGVTVNAIAPGPVDAPLIAGVPEEKNEDLVNRQIFQRKASLSDVYATVSLILSPGADLITGEVIHVGGV